MLSPAVEMSREKGAKGLFFLVVALVLLIRQVAENRRDGVLQRKPRRCGGLCAGSHCCRDTGEATTIHAVRQRGSVANFRLSDCLRGTFAINTCALLTAGQERRSAGPRLSLTRQ